MAGMTTQELIRRLAEDQRRSDQIAAEALTAWQEGRKVLVLSERTDHVTAIAAALEPDVPELFVLMAGWANASAAAA